ncbi:MAG: hypothetical protein RR285_14685 [Acinetobacter sp.]
MKLFYVIIIVIGVVTILSFIIEKVYGLFKTLATLPKKIRVFDKELSEKLFNLDKENEKFYSAVENNVTYYRTLIDEVEHERTVFRAEREDMLRAVENVFDNLQLLANALDTENTNAKTQYLTVYRENINFNKDLAQKFLSKYNESQQQHEKEHDDENEMGWNM